MKDEGLAAAIPIMKRGYEEYKANQSVSLEGRYKANYVLGNTLIFFLQVAEDDDWKEFINVLEECRRKI